MKMEMAKLASKNSKNQCKDDLVYVSSQHTTLYIPFSFTITTNMPFFIHLNITNSQYQMDAGIVASEMQAHRMREGPIYKRTKFLLHWEERWGVLTMNFLFIFSDKSLKQLTDYIDLRDLLSYKSYLRKDDDMIPSGFKLSTTDQMHYFCARNCNEKWSWIVSIQRLMDFKYTGKSSYNNLQWIRTRGFMSQSQFEKGRFDERVADIKQEEKPKVQIKPKDTPKVNQSDLQKKMKELEQQKQGLLVKEQELQRKSKEQQELFILQLNKLKKAQQALKQIQAQVQSKGRQAQKILEAYRQNKPREIIVEKTVEVIVQKIIQKPIHIQVGKNIQAKKVQRAQIKEEETILSPLPVSVKKQSSVGQKVAQMRKLYQNNKSETPSYPQNMTKSVVSQKAKEESKTKQTFLHLCRDKVIVNLFEQFHSKAYTYAGLRAIIEFMIKMCSDRSLGYQPYFIREAKGHQNRYVFAQVFLELITNNKDYTIGKSLSKLVELLIFQAPGIFKLGHYDIIKRKMADFLFNTTDDNDIASILKTMYVVHKVKKYEKNEKLQQKLKEISESKSQEAKNWARKLAQDL